MNNLKVLACDIHKAYVPAMCRENILTVAWTEFGPKKVKVVVVVRGLYGLKSSGAAFRGLLYEQFHDLGCRPLIDGPDVWIIPEVKPGGFMQYEYVLCYVYDMLCISYDLFRTMKVIRAKSKLKGDKIEEPDMYLGT